MLNYPLTMEHNLSAPQESKTPSAADETDRSDPTSDIGSGRSYECVFCKRGFTTAQALGGHMNIHRKDRVKTRTSSSSSSSSVGSNSSKLPDGFGYGSFRANQAVTQSFPTQMNYQTYLPSSTWSLGSTASQEKDELYVQNNPQLLNNAFKENWHRNSQVGASRVMDHHIQEKMAGNGEEDELDLELRLGHDR